MSAVRDEVDANVTRLEQRILELQYNTNSNQDHSNHGKGCVLLYTSMCYLTTILECTTLVFVTVLLECFHHTVFRHYTK